MRLMINNNKVINVVYEHEDTLEQVASTMKCSVYELIDTLEELRVSGWSGENLDWGDDSD